MTKKITKIILSLFCLTAVAATSFSTPAKAETAPDSVLVYGSASQDSADRITMTRQDGEASGQQIIINISEETKVLDAVTGNPVNQESLNGQTLYVYTSPVMTLSLPPITTAQVIFSNIPADYKVPEYITVDTLNLNGDGTGSITATNGKTYTVGSDCQIFPYLTRNIVVLDQLTSGRTCVVWTQSDGTAASRIMAFAAPVQTGWVLTDNIWYYYNSDGQLQKGWFWDGQDWFYLDPETGAMQTGFITVDGKTYYLESDGRMLTQPRTFTPDSSGALY
ncbi:MAG TPA: hypothetical protein H9740_05555 [Candidatus Hungatella pullicola]|nr:hypothetical protein [Candidatus Hungatella pullicola]